MITGRAWGVGVAVFVALSGGAAQAAQVVVMDQTWVHGPDMPDSHFRVPPMDGTPGNWVTPVDYSQGSAWVYLEVHSKPTLEPTRFQVCFEATPTYACTDQSPDYTEVGVYEWETPFANFYQGDMVDWTLGTNKLACILKDTMNGKPSADNVGPEIAALFMPTEVRMVVTLVEPGGVYEPPTPTGEGTTGGESSTGDATTGGLEDTGDAGTTSTGETTTGATTGTPATTDASGTTGTPGDPGDPTTGGPPPTTGPASDAGGESTGAAQDTSTGAGCGCATGPDSARAPALMDTMMIGMMIGMLGLTRRRRYGTTNSTKRCSP